MALGVNPQNQQLHGLYAQALAFLQNPPDNEQPLVALNLDLLNAAWAFPDEIEAINEAIVNVHEAFGRIAPHAAAGAALAPNDAGQMLQAQYDDVLIPPDPEQVFQEFMQILNDLPGQAGGLAQNAPQPERHPLQSVPASGGNAIQASASVPVAPITNASNIPSQQPVALQPSLLNRILQIFQSAIETLCTCFARFIAFCSSYFPAAPDQQSTQAAAQPGPIPIPALPISAPDHQEQPACPSSVQPAGDEPQAPVQHHVQPVPIPAAPVISVIPEAERRFVGVGHIGQELLPEQNHNCAHALAIRLWAHLLQERNEEDLPALITAAVADPNINLIQNWGFPRYGMNLTQSYRTELGLVNANAVQARQIRAVKIVKGNEVHLLMIDARNRDQLRFYYFNPYAQEGAYLQRFTRFNDMLIHLQDKVPIEADHPFQLVGIQPLQN